MTDVATVGAAPEQLLDGLKVSSESDTTTAGGASTETAEEASPQYPLKVLYCPICTLPAEVHDSIPKSQFEKCRPWLASHCPELFPDEFPVECAALRDGKNDVIDEADDEEGGEKRVKVAVPIEQKTSGGKKKKAPAEVVLALGQRKGKKQVTIVFGLDLFGIKLKAAAKAAKRKFATGSSVTTSPDSRDVIEIQGARQQDFANLVHTEFGVPKDAIFIVTSAKKKVAAFPTE